MLQGERKRRKIKKAITCPGQDPHKGKSMAQSTMGRKTWELPKRAGLPAKPNNLNAMLGIP